MRPATPNQALQRTAPGRHACCSPRNPPRSSHAVPPQSLSFGALGVLRAVLAICFPFILFASTFGADRKYGLAAGSDAELLAKARDPQIDAVILGCVYKYVPPSKHGDKASTSYVTVVESYKGELAVGEKTAVVIYAEECPTEGQELGALRFYFLAKRTAENRNVPAGTFTSDWTDALSYARYGDPLRQLFCRQLKPHQ